MPRRVDSQVLPSLLEIYEWRFYKDGEEVTSA